MADTKTLPPLPEPTLEDHEHELWGQNVRSDFYTADQMQSYARAALATQVQGPVDVNVSPLPCPFCGAKDVVLTRMDDEYEYVMCSQCGAQADSTDTLPERTPLEVWNMRANAGLTSSVQAQAELVAWLVAEPEDTGAEQVVHYTVVMGSQRPDGGVRALVFADALTAPQAAQPVAELVKCEQCGHENWTMEGKAPCQITDADKARAVQEQTTHHGAF